MSAFGVEHIRKGRLSFLHPAARAFDPVKASMRQAGNPRFQQVLGQATGHGAAGEAAALQTGSRIGVRGPKANTRIRSALSGGDLETTLGRLGRATRRQNKEFSALVHPISGRVLEMHRGSGLNVAIPFHSPSVTRDRAAALAARTKDPVRRSRALRVANGEGGPRLVQVHSHPEFRDPHTGSADTRHYPSSADLQGHAQQSIYRAQATHGVVLSHEPGPRGSRQTRAVHTYTEPLVTSTNPGGTRNLSLGAMLNRNARADAATQTKAIRRVASPDAREDLAGQTAAIRTMRAQRGERPLTGNQYRNYDALTANETTPKRAKQHGFRTQSALYKSAFGVEHVEKGMNPTRFARLYPPGTHNVPLRHMNAISDHQLRGSANIGAVADSMAREGQLHPVSVHIFDGRAHLMNGHHRVAGAKRLGWKKIKVQVEQGPYRSWTDPARGKWDRPAQWPPTQGKYSTAPLDEL